MLDIGWSEMLMIAAVAIIVIGPKEIPRTLGTIGRWIGKARSLAREFQLNVDDMIAQSEIDELTKTANSIGNFSTENILEDTAVTSVDRIEKKDSTISREQRDGEAGAGVLNNEADEDGDRSTRKEGEKILDNERDEANKVQRGQAKKMMPAKKTET